MPAVPFLRVASSLSGSSPDLRSGRADLGRRATSATTAPGPELSATSAPSSGRPKGRREAVARPVITSTLAMAPSLTLVQSAKAQTSSVALMLATNPSRRRRASVQRRVMFLLPFHLYSSTSVGSYCEHGNGLPAVYALLPNRQIGVTRHCLAALCGVGQSEVTSHPHTAGSIVISGEWIRRRREDWRRIIPHPLTRSPRAGRLHLGKLGSGW